MFTLAGEYKFTPDPKGCWLHALVGYDTGVRSEPKWHIKLQSHSIEIPFLTPEERGSGTDHIAFGIDCQGLVFDVADWKELSRRSVDVSLKSLRSGFQVLQWEDLTHLQLSFGKTRDRKSTRLNSSHIQKSRMPSSA